MKITQSKLKQIILEEHKKVMLEEYKKGDWLPALYKKIQNLNSQIDKIQGAMDNIEKKIEDGYVLDNTSPKVYKKTLRIYEQTFEEYDKKLKAVEAEWDELSSDPKNYMKKRGLTRFRGIATSLLRKNLAVYSLYPKYVNAYFDALEKNNFPTDARIVKRMKEFLNTLLQGQKDKLQQQMDYFQQMSALDKKVEDAEEDL